MLLVELTIYGVIHRISNEYCNLEHFYDFKVASAGSVKVSLYKRYGGFFNSSFGSISFLPDLFDEYWLPPVSCPIRILYGNGVSEQDAMVLFEGSAHLSSIKRDEITYKLMLTDIGDLIDPNINLTLTAYVEEVATALGLTLMNYSTRSDSIQVVYDPNEKNRLDILSEVTAFFTHFCWIEGDFLYLADVMEEYGNTLELTEFNIYPSTYTYNSPYNKFKCTVTSGSTSTDVDIDGSFTYGKEFNVSPVPTTSTTVATDALVNIKDITERPYIRISAPMEWQKLPKIGQRVHFWDESQHHPIEVSCYARSLNYNLDEMEVTIEGDGYLTWIGIP